jgi:hypothetical protein
MRNELEGGKKGESRGRHFSLCTTMLVFTVLLTNTTLHKKQQRGAF